MSDRILAAVYKVPPDPGPVTRRDAETKVVFNDVLDGGEESAPTMQCERLELQSIIASNLLYQEASFMSEGSFLQALTGSNLRYEEAAYTIQARPLKRAVWGVQFQSSILHLAKQYYSEHPKYSLHCLMAANGDQAAHRQVGKELEGTSKDGEKSVLVVNITGGRAVLRPRFMAVGLFLSVLLVNSRQLIDHMKKVWKIRGELEASPLESESGRKFTMEFSLEGDWKHTILGGPWQYKGDAFLVEGLAAGADPSSALFSHVPMWVQFRKIPFYLLTKRLAHDLGECMGDIMKIDDSARGSISDKFIRARVQLPLYKALKSEILLVDEITKEEVAVQLRYERLPNFCLFCGYIGHMEARCDEPVEGRKIRFSQNLRVRPVYFDDDLLRWDLPEEMGKVPKNPSPIQLWRAPSPAPGGQQKAISVHGAVDIIQAEVEKLSVVDKQVPANEINGSGSAGGVMSERNGETKASQNKNQSNQDGSKQAEENNMKPDSDTTSANKLKGWKRMDRNNLGEHSNKDNKQMQQQGVGSVRPREEIEDEINEMEPAIKKYNNQTVVGSVALEKENPKDGKEKGHTELPAEDSSCEDATDNMKGNITKESSGGLEATGLGATGNLSGAEGSARQGP
ncbi:unnamed protein product [Urochloa humidicola]